MVFSASMQAEFLILIEMPMEACLAAYWFAEQSLMQREAKVA